MPQGRFHLDKSGNRYGMLTAVLQLNERTANGSFKYIVQCDCGESKVVGFSAMSRGNTKSCGCHQYPKGKLSANYKHGQSRTKEYDLDYQMRKNYGIGLKEYDAMFKAQNGICAICSQEPPNHHKKRLNVDHCHSTGKIRGLLCDACNRGIGLLKDSPVILNNAISYLAR
jgi:hypothetical protein